MRHSFKTGFSFGVTSGIITTLGLMIGLHSGTQSRLAVIGGIVIIAIADACSDALGIHMSEESENKHTTREIWESTIITFITKFVFTSTFLVPVIVFELETAMYVSIAYGLTLLGIFSYFVGKGQGDKGWKVVVEHLVVAGIVITATHFVGDFVRTVCG